MKVLSKAWFPPQELYSPLEERHGDKSSQYNLVTAIIGVCSQLWEYRRWQLITQWEFREGWRNEQPCLSSEDRKEFSQWTFWGSRMYRIRAEQRPLYCYFIILSSLYEIGIVPIFQVRYMWLDRWSNLSKAKLIITGEAGLWKQIKILTWLLWLFPDR